LIRTKKQRVWFKDIFSDGLIPHKLIYLKADDQLCLRRLEQPKQSSPETRQIRYQRGFQQVTSCFQAPSDDKGFNLEIANQTDNYDAPQ
jgi:thymidylate kinase